MGVVSKYLQVVSHLIHIGCAEMRGLYILLTIDNDGGMEVLKYAARLYRHRPEVYHSKPVQLALDIFKVSPALFVPSSLISYPAVSHTRIFFRSSVNSTMLNSFPF